MKEIRIGLDWDFFLVGFVFGDGFFVVHLGPLVFCFGSMGE